METRPTTVPVRLKLPSGDQGGDGWSLGVQVFDPDSGRFLEEGRWMPIPDDGTLEADLAVPLEPGNYRLYISPVHEQRGWAYTRGARIWVLDVRVDEHEARILKQRLTTIAALRRANFARRTREALIAFVQIPWSNRALVGSLVRRDITARYRGSMGDIFWSWLNPLLLMATYLFVFGFVLHARFGNDPSPAGFALYFIAGMVPWLAFSEALARSPYLLIEYRTFVKKIRFPIETLPVVVTLSGLITSATACILYLIALASIGRAHWTALWLPVLLIPQVLLTLGLSWLLSAAGPYVRDLVQVIGIFLTLWFFMTPICYAESALPPQAWALLRWNPMLHLVRAWRAVLLEGHAPEPIALAKLWLIGIFASFAGFVVFYKLKKSIPDVI